jgi:hypothetical protein
VIENNETNKNMNMKTKEIWIKTDSFGRDAFSRHGVIIVEEIWRDKQGQPLCNGRSFGPLKAEVVREGSHWSDSINGVSGRNVLVRVSVPDDCGELIGEEKS